MAPKTEQRISDNAAASMQGAPEAVSMVEARAERLWQVAGDRLLLYLRCLNFSAPRALELALQALKEAERNLAGERQGNNPVAESMKALQRLLSAMRARDSGQEGGQSPMQPLPPRRRLPMVSAHPHSPAARRHGRGRRAGPGET